MLDIVAVKTAKMRGQAHVVFRDIQASTQAMRALQGFDFFGKEMVSPCPHFLHLFKVLKRHRKSNMPKGDLPFSTSSKANISR